MCLCMFVYRYMYMCACEQLYVCVHFCASVHWGKGHRRTSVTVLYYSLPYLFGTQMHLFWGVSEPAVPISLSNGVTSSYTDTQLLYWFVSFLRQSLTHCVALTGLELFLQTRLALYPQKSIPLPLPSQH